MTENTDIGSGVPLLSGKVSQGESPGEFPTSSEASPVAESPTQKRKIVELEPEALVVQVAGKGVPDVEEISEEVAQAEAEDTSALVTTANHIEKGKKGPNVALMEKYGRRFLDHYVDSATRGEDTLKRLGDVPYSKELKGLMKDNDAASIKFVEWTNKDGKIEWRYVLYGRKVKNEKGKERLIDDLNSFRVMKKEGKEWVEDYKYPPEEKETLKKIRPEKSVEIKTPQGFAVEYLDEMFAGKVEKDGTIKPGLVEKELKKGTDVYVELKPQAVGELLKQTLDIKTPDGVVVDIFAIRQEFDFSKGEKRMRLGFNARVKRDRKVLGKKIPGIWGGMSGEMVIGEASEDLVDTNIAVLGLKAKPGEENEFRTNPPKIYGKETKNLFESYLGGSNLENNCDKYFNTRIKEVIDSIVYKITDEGNIRVDFKAKEVEAGVAQPSILERSREELAAKPPSAEAIGETPEPVAVQEEFINIPVPIAVIKPEELVTQEAPESAEKKIGEKLTTPIDYILKTYNENPKDVIVYRLTGELNGVQNEDYAIVQLLRTKNKIILFPSMFNSKNRRFDKGFEINRDNQITVTDPTTLEATVQSLIVRMCSEKGPDRWQSQTSVSLNDIREPLEDANKDMKEKMGKA